MISKKLYLVFMCAAIAAVCVAQPGPEQGGRGGPRAEAMKWRRAAEAQTSPPRAGARRAGAWLQRGDGATSRVLERMTQMLSLTPEQRTKVANILEKAKGELGGKVGSLRDLGEKTREEIRSILTDEQRAKLDKFRENAQQTGQKMAEQYAPQMQERMKQMGQEMRLRMALRALDLKDDQRQKVEQIEKETQEKIKAIQEEVRPKIQAVREEAKKKLDEILTPEQREQLKKELEKLPAWSGRPDGAPQGPPEPGRQGPWMGRRPGGRGEFAPPPPNAPAPPAEGPQSFGWRPPLADGLADAGPGSFAPQGGEELP